MAPSQLKQLKASLRDQGLVGPSRSKKQKKQSANGRNDDARRKARRNAALESIRESFNPFEVKAPARKAKFDVTSSQNVGKPLQRKPGITKGLGEERRRETLLTEMRRRHKVGGILDRRFGENDPTMTPEQRAAERFARESERKSRKSNVFNLEDDDDGIQLTHQGQTISFENESRNDDFAESDVTGSESEVDSDRPKKRRRMSEVALSAAEEKEDDALPLERKKSKQEVMKEVIAKSKLHKYERQQAKEDDDELRRELDKGLPDFLEAMRNHKPPGQPPQPTNDDVLTHPDRRAQINGKEHDQLDEEYNEQVRQMALDKRSKPSSRTKTDEERAEEEADRLRELERKRLQRMRGDPESSEDELESPETHEDEADLDDAEVFGLRQNAGASRVPERDVEDEDEFVIDDELVANDSEAEISVSNPSSDASDAQSLGSDGEDDEFINGLSLPENDQTVEETRAKNTINGDLAYTFPCPRSLNELLEAMQKTNDNDIPTVVQRIRALHHPKLGSANTEKCKKFTAVLVEYISHLAERTPRPPFTVIEALIRHVHSLAKSYPDIVGVSVRAHLTIVAEERPLKLRPCDLILLTAVSTIFPTSDHFHSVVTPSFLTIARYLGQSSVQSLGNAATGIYCCSLALKYQTTSKRYVPEVMNYLLSTLMHLAPAKTETGTYPIPYRRPSSELNIRNRSKPHSSGLRFWTILEVENNEDEAKADLLQSALLLLNLAADLWKQKSAFIEMIQPAIIILTHLQSGPCKSILPKLLNDQIDHTRTHVLRLFNAASTSRQPLYLHNHRPLPIKTSFPKFDPAFNPTRHADPDRERANINKLRAEHKRERKGAMRELRKDANFIARESLREKKEKDEAYEKKFKKLREEIQAEEGKEKNEYEREKRKRKGRF
ncbi:MAG: hypothetical protein Q9160_002531 [Pyrenula sp. 1 TL-2023]